jgi:nitroreductase
MEFQELMRMRRSVNFFDPDKPVEQAVLEKIVEEASLTPSGFNLQPWNLLVVRSPEVKKRLRTIAWDQPKIEQAPVVLVVLADKDGWRPDHPVMEKSWQNQIDLGYTKPEMREWFDGAARQLFDSHDGSLTFAVRNACFFGMALMLAAVDAGLHSHPISGFDHDALMAELGLPENFVVPMMLVVGHFDEQQTLGPPKWRKSYREIVREEL